MLGIATTAANPITYIRANAPPFLIFHGNQDRMVSPSQTLILHEALMAAGVRSTRYVVDGAGHGDLSFMGDTQSGLLWSTNQVMNLIAEISESFGRRHLTCGSSPVLGKQAGAQCRENPALQRLAQGEPLLSLGIRNARTAEIVRMAKTAGFGLVWIDLEHSSISIDCAVQIIASAADLGIGGVGPSSGTRVRRYWSAVGWGCDGHRCASHRDGRRGAEGRQCGAFSAPRSAFPDCLLPQAKYRRMSAAELMRCADLATTVHILIESAEGVA